MSEKDFTPLALSEDELRERYINPAAEAIAKMVRDGEPLSADHIALLDSISSDWRMYYGISKWEKELANVYHAQGFAPPDYKP